MDSALKRRLGERLGTHLLGPVGARHDTTEIRIGPQSVTQVMRLLHDDPDMRFEVLADIAGVDTGTTMQVVYHLWSALTPDWLRVIADGLPREDPRIPSVTFLWNGAEWGEREAYDMFGIIFEGNRDLRRIYMPPDYQAFPLRKDFLLADDSARSPGMGVRPMEQAFPPGETRRTLVLRTSPGAVPGGAAAATGSRLGAGAGDAVPDAAIDAGNRPETGLGGGQVGP
jgi:NADH-quinone oxidoreductase subunit C